MSCSCSLPSMLLLGWQSCWSLVPFAVSPCFYFELSQIPLAGLGSSPQMLVLHITHCHIHSYLPLATHARSICAHSCRRVFHIGTNLGIYHRSLWIILSVVCCHDWCPGIYLLPACQHIIFVSSPPVACSSVALLRVFIALVTVYDASSFNG